MTSRALSDKEFEKILEDVRKELNAALAFFTERVADISLCRKGFNMEFGIVSPLY